MYIRFLNLDNYDKELIDKNLYLIYNVKIL